MFRRALLRLLAWLVPLGASALVAAFGTRDPADLPYFAHAARTLFSSRWADTFADPSLQVGPLQLVLVGICDRIGGLGFLAYAIEIALAAFIVFVVGRLLRGRPHRVAFQTLAGLAAVMLGVTADAYSYGHPAQVAVPLMWVLAALDAREGRTLRSGALLGLSAGLELWGVLGALYLPFVLGGDFRMFDYRWKVESWTLVRLLVPAGSDFPWGLRLLQGAVALIVGCAVALVLRRTERALWAVPFGIVATRVLLDPTLYSWYWLGLETLALVAAVELATSIRARWRLQSHATAPAAASTLRRG